MKKLMITKTRATQLIAAAFLFGGLMACGGESTTVEAEETQEETSTEAVETDKETTEPASTRTDETLDMSSESVESTEVDETIEEPSTMLFEGIYSMAEVEALPTFEECAGKETKEEKEKCFQKSLMKNLRKNVRYPADAKELEVQGKSYIGFVIDETGMVSEAKVIKSAGLDYSKSNDAVQNYKDAYASLDAEALNAIKATPKMSPALVNGKPVKVQFSLPVDFKLE